MPGQQIPKRPNAAARDALHVAVGLGVLGIQRFQAGRPDLERRFEALGLDAAATVTRSVGAAIDDGIARLLGSRPK